MVRLAFKEDETFVQVQGTVEPCVMISRVTNQVACFSRQSACNAMAVGGLTRLAFAGSSAIPLYALVVVACMLADHD